MSFKVGQRVFHKNNKWKGTIVSIEHLQVIEAPRLWIKWDANNTTRFCWENEITVEPNELLKQIL